MPDQPHEPGIVELISAAAAASGWLAALRGSAEVPPRLRARAQRHEQRLDAAIEAYLAARERS